MWKLIFGVACVLSISVAKADALPIPIVVKEIGFLYTQTAHIRIPIQSWKTLRDARIVKQDLDYSCSAALLAT